MALYSSRSASATGEHEFLVGLVVLVRRHRECACRRRHRQEAGRRARGRHGGLEILDVALKRRVPRVGDGADAGKDAFEIALLGPELTVEVLEACEITEGNAALGGQLQARTEAGEPLEHVLFPADALAVLAIADDVHARRDLFGHDRTHGAPQCRHVLGVGHGAVHAPAQQGGKVGGPYETADVCRENAFRGAGHAHLRYPGRGACDSRRLYAPSTIAAAWQELLDHAAGNGGPWP